MTRRELLIKSKQVALLGITASMTLGPLLACAAQKGDTSTEKPNGAAGTCTGSPTSTYTNPGHAHSSLNLTAEQLALAAPGNYELLGPGTHSHFFALTAEDFRQIAAGQTVSKTDLEGHGHIIEVRCV